jgi:hypothetical protein
MIQFEAAGNITRALLRDQAHAQLREHLLALLPKAQLLVEDEPAFLGLRHFFREGLSALLHRHAAGELHLHLHCHQRQLELENLLFLVLRHASNAAI